MRIGSSALTDEASIPRRHTDQVAPCIFALLAARLPATEIEGASMLLTELADATLSLW
jgi:hypothetical protein